MVDIDDCDKRMWRGNASSFENPAEITLLPTSSSSQAGGSLGHPRASSMFVSAQSEPWFPGLGGSLPGHGNSSHDAGWALSGHNAASFAHLLHNGSGSGQSFTPGGQTHFPPSHTFQGGHPSQHSVTLMHRSLHSFVPGGQTHFPLMHSLPLTQPPQGTTGKHWPLQSLVPLGHTHRPLLHTLPLEQFTQVTV